MDTTIVIPFIVVAIQLTVTAELDTSLVLPGVYNYERNRLINEDQILVSGRQKELGKFEQLVDVHLKKLKRSEFEAGLADPSNFAPSMHFFAARPLIEKSAVFRLLRSMPKGALLHGHTSALVSAAWIVQNLTYRTDVLRCESADGQMRLTFRPLEHYHCVQVMEDRAAAPSSHEYDSQLEERLTLIVEQPQLVYSDTNTVWTAFERLFKIVRDLCTYEHTYRLWYWRLLQELYDDRLMYAEVRTGLSLFQYDDNRVVNESDVVRELQLINEDFKRTHPRFLGMKIIYAKYRKTSELELYLHKYRVLKAEFPDLIVGFDLVGQEDNSNTLQSFSEILLANRDIDYVFHAGESDWDGFGAAMNLFDAVLLNTTRIGHGYALLKQPHLMDVVRQRRICLEVCPISNQVLGLVKDLRNHPAALYSRLNVPIVIASDDPAFWGATGLSYDMYYALMSFSTAHTGLAYVKQLALNSLTYARLSDAERRKAFRMFRKDWEIFVASVIQNEGLKFDDL